MNACVRVEADLDARELLAAAKRIEVELGRDPEAPRHSARPLDIDVLLIADERVEAPDYQVPHAQIEQRRFVLEPLLELDPPERESLEAALARIADQRVDRRDPL
jgi:2-amino-4-hydroxy-6-hydroxymethyldihydropteridine diphosphokinase